MTTQDERAVSGAARDGKPKLARCCVCFVSGDKFKPDAKHPQVCVRCAAAGPDHNPDPWAGADDDPMLDALSWEYE